MLPASHNLDIYRGDTGRWQFKLWADPNRITPSDLTGVIVEARIRDAAVGGSFQISLACAVTLPNIVNMTLTSTQSRSLPAVGSWDMQLTYPSGDLRTVLRGSVVVTQDITYGAVTVPLTVVK